MRAPSRKAPPRPGPKGALSVYKKLPGAPPHPAAASHPLIVSSSKPISYKLPLLIAGGLALVAGVIAIAVVAGLKLFPGQSSSSAGIPAIFATPPTVGPTLCTHGGNQPYYEVGTVASFEWPWVGYGLYDTGVAESCSQPWEHLHTTIASMGSVFDPAPGLAAPDGVHYGVFQAASPFAPDDSVWWYIPNPGIAYTLSFYYSSVGSVHGNCTVGQNSTIVWTNQNIAKTGTWILATGVSANAPSGNIYALEVVCQGSGVVLFDAFTIALA